jgi:hypothetical protein
MGIQGRGERAEDKKSIGRERGVAHKTATPYYKVCAKFYLKRECGNYACGLARQGIIMIKLLHIHAEEDVFLGPKWYLALRSFKNNPSISIISFTVEQIIISRIASTGMACIFPQCH